MNKNKFPVVLSFDVDGETLWLARDPENIKRPVNLSLGQYGIIEGTPRILRLLDKYGIKASFFVPGYIADKYPGTVESIFSKGHEIGNHGYSHQWPDSFPDKKSELQEYKRSNEIIESLTGKRPVGYRSPAWEFGANTVDILEELNFKYSSNMMHTHNVHFLKIGERKTDLVELPIHWMLDDAAFWLYSIRLQGKAMQPISSVEECWIAEFDGLYEEFNGLDRTDSCLVLTCHPQVVGRPSRIKALENVIKHISAHKSAEFVMACQLAERFRKKN